MTETTFVDLATGELFDTDDAVPGVPVVQPDSGAPDAEGDESGGSPAGAPASSTPRRSRLRWSMGSTGRRRRYPIRAYVGLNGSGKTLCAVKDLEPSIRAGRRILSTVPILDPYTGGLYEHYERLTEWDQVLQATSADLLFDEILGIANARSATGGMPVQVQLILNKLRHADLTLSWTAPSWSRADVIIREVTQAVTVCRGYFPKSRTIPGEDESRSWAGNRLFRFLTYDAADFTAWTDSKEGNLRGIANEWMRGPGSLAFARYDTLGGVDRVGEILDSGRCAHCGGNRPIPRCTCER